MPDLYRFHTALALEITRRLFTSWNPGGSHNTKDGRERVKPFQNVTLGLLGLSVELRICKQRSKLCGTL